jgi:hypothetical protein
MKRRARDWRPNFLDAIRRGESAVKAAAIAGVDRSTPYSRKGHDAWFAGQWKAATDGKTVPPVTLVSSVTKASPEGETTRNLQWRKSFLETLAETSNVSAAAASANVPPRTAYKMRRSDPEFAAKWLAALAEGYDHLEMEVLGYLRDPEPKRKMDVAAALRILAAHRETVERRRALTEEEDEQATVEALDAFFEGLKQRRLANERLLAEADGDDGDA